MNKYIKLGVAAAALSAVVPAFAEEAEVEEEGAVGWTPVAMETVSCNKPKSLEFYVPDGLADGNYGIVVRTRYCTANRELKFPVTAISRPVSVAANAVP